MEEVPSTFKQEELEHFVERANEVLGQEILDGIAMLDRAQYKLAKAKTPEVRQSAIHEYISAAKALGLEVQYEENDGDVYQ